MSRKQQVGETASSFAFEMCQKKFLIEANNAVKVNGRKKNREMCEAYAIEGGFLWELLELYYIITLFLLN